MPYDNTGVTVNLCSIIIFLYFWLLTLDTHAVHCWMADEAPYWSVLPYRVFVAKHRSVSDEHVPFSYTGKLTAKVFTHLLLITYIRWVECCWWQCWVCCGRDSAWKPQARTQVDLSRVDRVQTGQRTRKFSRFSDKHRSVNGHSLSLIYGESVRRGHGRERGWAGGIGAGSRRPL